VLAGLYFESVLSEAHTQAEEVDAVQEHRASLSEGATLSEGAATRAQLLVTSVRSFFNWRPGYEPPLTVLQGTPEPYFVEDAAEPTGAGRALRCKRVVGGGEYRFGAIPVTVGQPYTLFVWLRWVGGYVPFLGTWIHGDLDPIWAVGWSYGDKYGPCVPADPAIDGWQLLRVPLNPLKSYTVQPGNPGMLGFGVEAFGNYTKGGATDVRFGGVFLVEGIVDSLGLVESHSLAESLVAGLLYLSSATESHATSEQVASTTAMLASLSEALGLAESLGSIATLNSLVSEEALLSEEALSNQLMREALAESLSHVASAVSVAVLAVALQEAAELSEAAGTRADLTALLAESSALTEALASQVKEFGVKGLPTVQAIVLTAVTAVLSAMWVPVVYTNQPAEPRPSRWASVGFELVSRRRADYATDTVTCRVLVTFYYALGTGTAQARSDADFMRSAFPAGRSFKLGPQYATVTTCGRAAATNDNKWHTVEVVVTFTASIPGSRGNG